MKKAIIILGILVTISLALNVVVLANTIINSNQVSYSNNKTEETTVNGALNELFSTVDINEKLGNTESLSNVSDGTVAGVLNELYSTRSHVGMVIQSTTLDTMEKVKAMYGGTTWTKIEGKFLLGQSSSYAINSTGGSATNTLSVANLPSHTHSIPALSGSASHVTLTGSIFAAANIAVNCNQAPYFSKPSGIFSVSSYTDTQYFYTGGTYATFASDRQLNINASHSHTVTTNASTTGATGSGTAVNNMPPYKAVYIWERTA